ncbi:hypothetical protein HT136_20815 [Novosphingobium profundi]|uniref:hypothetical protein n=1 Tax=Novosphingobium profundi TaxID=1774954 RepID=UPI001BDA92AA|nr:hypothetical protein [Novosphingobium profundi]MBT0670813.1 hypothetical protein [Novosphingobium profundi]
MNALARREVLALAAAAVPMVAMSHSAAALEPAAARASRLLVHDAALPVTRAFAARAQALGTPAIALQGDPIRQARQLLGQRPMAIFGMTRASDHLLFTEVAREMGYEELVRITHRAGCLGETRCREGAEAFAALARANAPLWPEAFAELALGAVPQCGTRRGIDAGGSSFSWVLRPKN